MKKVRRVQRNGEAGFFPLYVLEEGYLNRKLVPFQSGIGQRNGLVALKAHRFGQVKLLVAGQGRKQFEGKHSDVVVVHPVDPYHGQGNILFEIDALRRT